MMGKSFLSLIAYGAVPRSMWLLVKMIHSSLELEAYLCIITKVIRKWMQLILFYFKNGDYKKSNLLFLVRQMSNECYYMSDV